MKVIYLVLGLMLIIILACAKKEETKVVARIGDKVITLEEFEKEVESLPDFYKPLLLDPKAKREFLEKLIDREILLLEARKAGVYEREDVRRKIEECEKGVILDAFLSQILREKDEVTEEEAKRYYDEHKEEFFMNESIRVRHIVVRTLEEAKEIKKRLEQGEDFVELAKRYSISPSGKWGGDLGYIQRGQVGKEFEKAAFSLKRPGEISDIVKTTFGYHIIRLEDRKPPRQLSFEEVRDKIIQKLKEQKKQKALEDYLKNVKKQYKIVINEKLLEGGK
jgi:peptidyl-prolyl cis-trans isomerase C